MVVRIRVVDLVGVFIVNLKLDKVDALLKKVDVSEVLQMQDELGPRSIGHNLNNK